MKRISRYLIGGFLFLLAPFLFASAVPEEEPLVVATSGTLYPASFYAGDNEDLTGFDVEVMREVAARMGVEVEFEIMAFDAMLAAVQTGRVDAAVNDISRTAEREERLDFSEPYKYSFATLMVRADDLSGIASLDDLAGKVHAGEATTTYARIMGSYGAETLTYDNATNDQYLRDLELGRSDVIMNDYYLQRLALQFMPEFELTIHPDFRFFIEPGGTHVVLPKGSDALRNRINAALDSMRTDGTLTAISEQFFDGADVSEKPDGDAGFIVVDVDEL